MGVENHTAPWQETPGVDPANIYTFPTEKMGSTGPRRDLLRAVWILEMDSRQAERQEAHMDWIDQTEPPHAQVGEAPVPTNWPKGTGATNKVNKQITSNKSISKSPHDAALELKMEEMDCAMRTSQEGLELMEISQEQMLELEEAMVMD